MNYRKLLTALAVLTLILLIVWLALTISTGRLNFSDEAEEPDAGRTNTQCTTEERVFDYADVLSDQEEEDLRELIAKHEQKTKCDIVLVTLNESLQNYQPAGSYYVPMETPENWIRAYADDFWDTHYFGYNTGLEGDGVLLADDWYREPYDGKMHTWLSTSGSAYARLGDYEIDRILDEVYEDIETDPFRAYSSYVTYFSKIMTSGSVSSGPVIVIDWYTVLFPLILALAVLAYFWRSRKGRITVDENTYINRTAEGRGIQVLQSHDRFLHKHVTRQRIVRSEGGGGGGGFGGGHISSGGMSHGGGGHSR